MRALVFVGPGELQVQDRHEPDLTDGQSRLRVLATGICGSDLHGFTGANGRRHPGQVMGHETVAEVIETYGESLAETAPGRLVTVNPVVGCGGCPSCHVGQPQTCATRRVIGVDPTISAAMALTMVAPSANLVALPAELNPDLGALVEPLAVGHHGVVRGAVGHQDRVLVIGAGPIGQAAALAARRAGASSILVSEPVGERRDLLVLLGFDTADPRSRSDPGSVHEPLGGEPTVVVDTVGSSASLVDALTLSGYGARIVLVGMDEPAVALPAYKISTEERTLIGSFCYSCSDFADTAEWLAQQGDSLLPLIDTRISLDQAPGVFAGLSDHSMQASKVLIYPNGPPRGRGRLDVPDPR